jgi:sulfur-oxidizing protein SoxX
MIYQSVFRELGRILLTATSSLLITSAANIALAAEVSPEAIEAGRAIAADRKLGNCYTCHQVEGADLAGNVAPPLVFMTMRYPDREALRAQIADPRIRNPNTIMPPYGAYGILTEQELDQLTDYVFSL